MKTDLKYVDERRLQQQLQQKDCRAFEIVFNRYWKDLYRYAYRIYRQERICEDIVQEVFISLWEKLPGEPVLNLEAYLLRAVKYRVLNHIRDLRFSREDIEILKTIPHPDQTTCLLEFSELEGELLKKINKLSPKCREVFLLSRFESYSNHEIAEKLNLSIRTVEKHISNALSFLREHMDQSRLALFVTGVLLLC